MSDNYQNSMVAQDGGIKAVLRVAFPLIVAASGHAFRLFADRVMLSTLRASVRYRTPDSSFLPPDSWRLFDATPVGPGRICVLCKYICLHVPKQLGCVQLAQLDVLSRSSFPETGPSSPIA